MHQNVDQPQKMAVGFPVDDCFGRGVGRSPLDNLAGGRVEKPAEMVTFEEFIRGKRSQAGGPIGGGLDLRPIDEDGANQDDGFFDIGLDTARDNMPPEDPPSCKMSKAGGARSKMYAVEGNEGEGGGRPTGTLMPMSGGGNGASFRQSFCPTVGEGGRWLGVGGHRRDSQDSAAYGFDLPPEEPRPEMAEERGEMRGMDHQNWGHIRPPCSAFDAAFGTFTQRRQEDGRQLVVCRPPAPTSTPQSGNLLLSKFFCCFRAVDGNGAENRQQKCGGGAFGGDGGIQQQQPKIYSWDLRQSDPEASGLMWRGVEGETRVKEPGQLAGNAFQIEACSNSTLVLLDQSASITIDDCRDCVILCGPCRGSIFLRDCTNLLVLAVCQQFRTRDCRQLTAHLFCPTSPTIEETQMEAAPLLLAYAGLQSQMFAAGLSPFANRWNKVHNFTPDTGKCQILQNAHPMANPSTNAQLVHRLNQFLSASSIVENLQLKVGSCIGDTQLFFDASGQQKSNQPAGPSGEERILVLLQPLKEANMRFYSESVELVRELLDASSTNGPSKLVAMHDVDLRPGEWEILFLTDARKGDKQNAQPIRKIVAIEVAGPRGLAQNAEWICQQERKATSARLMDREQMENQRKQLYRLCEIRQSI